MFRAAQDARRYANFSRWYCCFRGVYASFREAEAAAPRRKSIGYNDEALAAEYKQSLDTRAESYDYPVLFWLARLMRPGVRVFDFGGNVGRHFYTCRRYLALPADIDWLVCEVPAIARAGEELAASEGARGLHFTCEAEAADGCDIFLASGSLQYRERPSLAEHLQPLTRKPIHLVLNRMPIYDGEPFVTLQNGGRVYYAQSVYNRAQFISGLAALGYSEVDAWDDLIDQCVVPFHPERSLRVFRGLYLRHSSA